MKILGFQFGQDKRRKAEGAAGVASAVFAAARETSNARLDSILAPMGDEVPGASKGMSYRAVFEMVGAEVLKDLRLNRGQADIEILRMHTGTGAPKYQVIVFVHIRAILNPIIMIEFTRCFADRLRVISRPAMSGLSGVSWAISKNMLAKQDFQATDVLTRNVSQESLSSVVLGVRS